MRGKTCTSYSTDSWASVKHPEPKEGRGHKEGVHLAGRADYLLSEKLMLIPSTANEETNQECVDA